MLGVVVTNTRGGGHRLISSKTSSDLCCAVFALNAISLWENQLDALADINTVHPLVNLNEISFIDLCYVQIIYTTLDYHKITIEHNSIITKHNLLCLFTKFPCGSYYVQLNVNPNGPHDSRESVHHVVAVQVKQHWSKLSSPASTVALITDNSMEILEVQKKDEEEAIANDSGLNIFE